MSQLSKQLRTLQLSPAGAATTERFLTSTAPSGASFLFSKSDAKTYSREQILSLATDGLRTLLQIDNRFHSFLPILFHPDKTREERALLRDAENQRVQQAIDALLVLLSPHLFLTASHQVLEYLIRVHEVHTYHPASLLRAFLPYHDHNLFSRLLLLLDLRDTGFDFLEKNQERGAPLLQEDLILACTQSRRVLQLVCECMILPVRLGVYHGAANALFAAVASRLAVSTGSASSRPEGLWRQLLPFILECFTTSVPGGRQSGGVLAGGSTGGEEVLAEQLAMLEVESEADKPWSVGYSVEGLGGIREDSLTGRGYRARGQEIPIHHREAVCTAMLVVAAWSTEVQFSVPVMLTLLKPVLAYTREQASATVGREGGSAYREEARLKRRPPPQRPNNNKGEEKDAEGDEDPTSVFFKDEQEEEERSGPQRSGKEVILMPLENWLLFLDFLFRTQNVLHEKQSQNAFAGVFRMLLQVPWRIVMAMNPVYVQLHLQQRQAAEEDHFLASFSSSMKTEEGTTGERRGKGEDTTRNVFASKTEHAIPLAALLSSLMHFSLERIRVCHHLSSLSSDVRVFLEITTCSLPLPLPLVQEVLLHLLRTYQKVLGGQHTNSKRLQHRSTTTAEEEEERNRKNDEAISEEEDVLVVDPEEQVEAFSFFQTLLEALERRYPRLFDRCLCTAMEDPELSSVAAFILSHHLSGTRYKLISLPPPSPSSSPLEDVLSNEPLPLFACFMHPSPEVRKLGAEAAHRQLSLTELLGSSSSPVGLYRSTARESTIANRMAGENSVLALLAHALSYETNPTVVTSFLQACTRPLLALGKQLLLSGGVSKDSSESDHLKRRQRILEEEETEEEEGSVQVQKAMKPQRAGHDIGMKEEEGEGAALSGMPVGSIWSIMRAVLQAARQVSVLHSGSVLSATALDHHLQKKEGSESDHSTNVASHTDSCLLVAQTYWEHVLQPLLFLTCPHSNENHPRTPSRTTSSASSSSLATPKGQTWKEKPQEKSAMLQTEDLQVEEEESVDALHSHRRLLYTDVLYATVLLYGLVKRREADLGMTSTTTTTRISAVIFAALTRVIPELSKTPATTLPSPFPNCVSSSSPPLKTSSSDKRSLQPSTIVSDVSCEVEHDMDILYHCPSLLMALYEVASPRLPELLRLTARLLGQQQQEGEEERMTVESGNGERDDSHGTKVIEKENEEEEEIGARRRLGSSQEKAPEGRVAGTSWKKNTGRESGRRRSSSSPSCSFLTAVYEECMLATTCCLYVELQDLNASGHSHNGEVDTTSTPSSSPRATGRAARLLHYFLLGARFGEWLVQDAITSANIAGAPLKQARQREEQRRNALVAEMKAKEEEGEEEGLGNARQPSSARNTYEQGYEEGEGGYLFALQHLQREALRAAQQQQQQLSPPSGRRHTSSLEVNKIGRGAQNSILTRVGYLPENAFTKLLGKAVYSALTLGLCMPASMMGVARQEGLSSSVEDGDGKRATNEVPSSSCSEATALHLTVLLLPLLGTPLPSLALAPHRLPYAYSRLVAAEMGPWKEREDTHTLSPSNIARSESLRMLKKYFEISFFSLVRDAMYATPDAQNVKERSSKESSASSHAAAALSTISPPSLKEASTRGWWGALGLVFLLPLCTPGEHHALREKEVVRLQETILHAVAASATGKGGKDNGRKGAVLSEGERCTNPAFSMGVMASSAYASPAEMVIAAALRGVGTFHSGLNTTTTTTYSCSMTALNSIVESLARASSRFSMTPEAAKLLARCFIATWGEEKTEVEWDDKPCAKNPCAPSSSAAAFTFMLPRGLVADAITYFFPLPNDTASSSSRSGPLLRLPLDVLYPSTEALLESVHYTKTPAEGGSHPPSSLQKRHSSSRKGIERRAVSLEVAHYLEVICARSFIASSSVTSSSSPSLPVGVRLAMELLRHPVLDTTTSWVVLRPVQGEAREDAVDTSSPYLKGGIPRAVSTLTTPEERPLLATTSTINTTCCSLPLYPYALSLLAKVFQEGLTMEDREDYDGVMEAQRRRGGHSGAPFIFRAATSPSKQRTPADLSTREPPSSSSTSLVSLSPEDLFAILIAVRPLLFSAMRRMGSGASEVARLCVQTIGGYHRVLLPLLRSLRHRGGGEGRSDTGRQRVTTRRSMAGAVDKKKGGTEEESTAPTPEYEEDVDLREMKEFELWEILVELLTLLVPPSAEKATQDAGNEAEPQKSEESGEKAGDEEEAMLVKRWMTAIRNGVWVPPADCLVLRPLTFTEADAMLALCANALPCAVACCDDKEFEKRKDEEVEAERLSSRAGGSKKKKITAVPFTLAAQPASPPSSALTEWVLRVLSLLLRIAPTIRPIPVQDTSGSDSDGPPQHGGDWKARGITTEEEAKATHHQPTCFPQKRFLTLFDFLQEAFLSRFPLVSFLPLLLTSEDALPLLPAASSALLLHGNTEDAEEVTITASSSSTKGTSLMPGSAALAQAVSFLSVPAIGFSRFTVPVLHVWQTLIALSLHEGTSSCRAGKSGLRSGARGGVCTSAPADVLLRAQLIKEGLRMMIALLSLTEVTPADEKENPHKKSGAVVSVDAGTPTETTMWTERRIAVLTAIFQTLSPLLARSSSSEATPQNKEPWKRCTRPLQEEEEKKEHRKGGHEWFALHIPLVALLIRLEPLDHSATLGFQSAVDLCRRILTSFNGPTQMLCLSALMELVMNPEEALKHFYHPLRRGTPNPRSDVLQSMDDTEMAKVFRKVVKPNQVINRQDLILEVIHTTAKSDSFLEKFVAIQFLHSSSSQERRAGSKETRGGKQKEKSMSKKTKTEDKDDDDEEGEEGEETEEDGVAACTALLTSSLSLFSHYSDLNAATPLPLLGNGNRGPFSADTLPTSSKASLRHRNEEEEEMNETVESAAMEAKAFVTILERLAGQTLACVLAGIHENTFVQCLHTLLADQRVSIQQKGLEVLLDRLHHSLPTIVDENPAGGAGEDEEVEAYRRSLRDPKQKSGLEDFIRIRARPRTTKRSFSLLPLLDAIITSSLSALSDSAALLFSSQVGEEKWEERGLKDFSRLVLSVSCMEELIRVVASGGSLQAEKTLLNVHRSKSVAVGTLVKLFGNKKRLDEVRRVLHAVCTEWIPSVQTALSQSWNALRKLREEERAPHQKGREEASVEEEGSVATTTTISSALSVEQMTLLQHRIPMYMHCLTGLFTFLGTCGQVLGAGFMLPHCQEVLEVIVSSALDQVFAVSRFPPFTPLPSAASFSFVETTLRKGREEEWRSREEESTTSTTSSWKEAHSLCRYATLTALLRTFPSCWHMSEPFLPGLLLVASHTGNVEDPRTQPLCREVLAVLEAVLEPSLVLRAAVESVWGWDRTCFLTAPAAPSSDTPAISASSSSLSLHVPEATRKSSRRSNATTPKISSVLRMTLATHSLPFFFQNGVHRLVERLSREDILRLRFLCEGSTTRENFWVASLDMLANSPVLPPSDTIGVVLEAFYTFFIKFKAKHCNVYLKQLGLWAFGEASVMHAAASTTDLGKKENKGKEKLLEKEKKDLHPSSALSGSLSRSHLHRWTLFYSLYHFLLMKMGSIMDFSFGVVVPYVTQHLHRFSEEISGKSWGAITEESNSEEEADAEEDQEETHSTSCHRRRHHRGGWATNKALTFRLTRFVLEVLHVLRRICTSCTPGPQYDYSVPPEVYVAHPDVFKALMPVLIGQIGNFEWFKNNRLQDAEYDVKHTLIQTIRAFFTAVGYNRESGNKLQARTQGEILRLLRHPHPSVRRLALHVLDGVYEDGGEELAARLMAEMLPSVVEMTEDRNELVVDEARTLCSHLSTITGQDVLHAMS